ncbi:MAG TPA: hypothetical protein VFK52_09380 [Nocardioidaceae bacterium]|nr:hypothetical protein [Nocardioidaceae bacterium]
MSVPPAPGPQPARILVSLVLLLALPLAGAGVLGWQVVERVQASQDAEAAEQADKDAVRAATLQVMNWASVDYQKLDEYFTTVKNGATGEFLEQFEQTEPTLRQGLTENQSIQIPTIPTSGVALLERKGDEAAVLVAIDAVVTNRATKGQPQPRQYRMKATVRRLDDAWLISKLEYVG